MGNKATSSKIVSSSQHRHGNQTWTYVPSIPHPNRKMWGGNASRGVYRPRLAQRSELVQSLLTNHAFVVAKGRGERFDTTRPAAGILTFVDLSRKVFIVIVLMLVSAFSEHWPSMYKPPSLYFHALHGHVQGTSHLTSTPAQLFCPCAHHIQKRPRLPPSCLMYRIGSSWMPRISFNHSIVDFARVLFPARMFTTRFVPKQFLQAKRVRRNLQIRVKIISKIVKTVQFGAD